MLNQKEVCEKFEAEFIPCLEPEKLGLAIKTIGQLPVNGLRHKAENGTCGWYIWCGEEMSQYADFFKPLHVNHINEYLPEVEQYLVLPPEYRFLITDGCEDVWHDLSIINM
ncbi:hypothetical protein SAMN02745753_02217 [Marinomonas polaris DSM 16579]|uniref:Imm33-like domain-containing protein n=1 Tax=Marinomonas polaris DSM 16579 TaxID=1122206 RepID=A0A1M5CQM9_9GAMM|nr:hypothetical protein [Marinomonas polaris]SHF57069.1 hypothetical protein SAMN02745753_02217 [Marinomonas polaris DSM 16579]